MNEQPKINRTFNRCRLLIGTAALFGMANFRYLPLAHADTRFPQLGKVLVAYFSRTGFTRQVANLIHQHVGGDLLEIIPTTAYPADYYAVVELNRHQQEQGIYPEMRQTITNLAEYHTIFLGYPIWAMDLPRFLYPFLQQHDFGGKTLAPFCTHAMSGLSGTTQRLQQLCPTANVIDGLAIQGAGRGQNQVITQLPNEAEAQIACQQWLQALTSRSNRDS
ncbi:flavodoxin [Testudinibacter sp. P27/CKL/0425]